MVKVPEYTQDQRLRPAFTQYRTDQATPESFGADIGRGMSKMAAGLSDAATSAFRVQELDDTTRAKEADNKFAAWKRERMFGENGYMLTEGKNAVDGRAAFETEIAEKRKEFGAGLSGGAARHYDTASNARVQSTLESTIRHSAQGRKKWVTDASNARISSFENDAMVNAGNPAAVDKNVAAGVLEIREQGGLHGWDADTLKVKESEFVSGVHKNIALGIAERDPMAASKYLKLNEGKFTGSDRFAIDKALDAPLKRANTADDASRILGTAPAYEGPGSQNYAPEKSQSPLAAPAKAGAVPARVPNGDVVDDGQGGAAPAQTLPGLTGTARPDRRGNYNYLNVASSLVGMNEVRDQGAISAFIKRSSGIEIDPSKTAWCAAFVNGVLGANGVKGTGSLAARSFMNFGSATDDPRPGDIAVFARGGPSSGHVGFFKGFDAQGNIIVIGGNQSNSVSETTMDRGMLLGFRRASGNSGGDAPPLNQTMPGLLHIESELEKVDPSRRAAVRAEISGKIELNEKLQRIEREGVQKNAEKWLIENPNASPDSLPLDVRQKLGVSGMTTLHSYHKEVAARGQPVTDARVKSALQTQYADDPELFGSLDLFKYRDRLSNEDWKEVNSWRQTARTDMRKARDEGGKINEAFGAAKVQLEAVGVIKPAAKMQDADRKRLAAFHVSLTDEMDAFKRENKKNPTQAEVQSIINRLLLPVVIKTPGALWGTNSKDGLLFETRTRPDNSTVDVNVQYADIPIDIRRGIAGNLERTLGRKPSPAEVTSRYEKFVTGRWEPATVPVGQSGFDDE